MRILISNDDGIYAPGLLALCREMAALGEITVVAPDSERSAASHSLSLRRSLELREVDLWPDVKAAYALSGTPADCGKLAMEYIFADARPDLVLSGVNHGPNTGTDIMYSGTVAAAFEGFLGGSPAMSISLASNARDVDFSFSAQVALHLCSLWQKFDFQPKTLFNVNVPPLLPEEIKGIRFSSMGYRKYLNIFQEGEAKDGRRSFIMSGQVFDDGTVNDSDVSLVRRGYISVTPLACDLTNHRLLSALWENKVKLPEMKEIFTADNN